MPTVTAQQRSSLTSDTQHNPILGSRLRRALKFALPPAVLIGAAMGVVQANPALLPTWLPSEFALPEMSFLGMDLVGVISGAIVSFGLSGAIFPVRLGIALLVVAVGWLSFAVTRGIVLNLFLHNYLTSIGETQTII